MEIKPVKGEGPRNPKLIVICEAPGEEEVYQGRPLVGPSGKVFEGILESAGLVRKDCFLDNVVPIRPPNNKIERLHEIGGTVEMFIPNLTQTILSLDCPVVLACGDLALWVLTGKGERDKKGMISGITKHRGSVYGCVLDDRKLVIPTFHPRFVIENWKMRGVVVEDIRKTQRVRKEGHHEVRFNTITKPTMSEVETFIGEIDKVDKFTFDIEVVGGDQIACIGLGYQSGVDQQRHSICIPFKHGYNNYWQQLEEIFIWEMLRELFQKDHLKVGQNLNYDFTKLLPFIGEASPPWYDMMVAHHLIEAELPHSLAFLCSLYTWPTVNYYKDDPKDEEKGWKYSTSSEKLWEYNGKDVEVPLMIEPILTQELKQSGMLGFFQGFLMPKMRVLWRIQQRGLLLDEEKRKELLKDQMEDLEEKKQELNRLVGYEINALSSKQMIKLLYEDLKLPPQRDRKTKKLTTSEDALNKLYAYHPNPIFRLALDIREKVKEIGTYLEVEPEEDGRVRGRYNAAGTTTGRSSSKKNYSGRGLDLHNIPEEDRQMFIPSPGKVFLMRDLWQAEAFVVALLARCQSFLHYLKQGKKTHKLVASWIYGIPEEEVDNNNKPGGQYYTGKRTGHGLNYGLGPVHLAITLQCSVKRAKEIRDIYFKRAFEIEGWQREIREELTKTRQLVTPLGRKRVFRDRLGDELWRKGYAHIPQSTIGEYNHLAMIKLEYALPDGAEIVQEGYDSLLFEVDEEIVEEVEKVIDWGYEKKVLIGGELVKIPTEGGKAKRWIK